MIEKLKDYKGVILLLLTLVLVVNTMSNRVQELNAIDETNNVVYYDK